MMRGLSLIESLITIGIMVLIMGAIVDSVLSFYRANTSAIEQEYQVESARKGIEVFVRDVREATYGDDGSYPLGNIGTSTVTFFADTDQDGSIERVRYMLVGTALYRNVVEASGSPAQYTGSGATTTVSNFVRNASDGTLLFRYYNASNVEVTQSSQIVTVVSATIQLVVDITQVHTPGKFTLKGSATLRNLRAQ